MLNDQKDFHGHSCVADANYWSGRCYTSLAKHRLALASYQMAQKLYKLFTNYNKLVEDLTIHTMIGTAYFNTNDYQLSIESLERALRENEYITIRYRLIAGSDDAISS